MTKRKRRSWRNLDPRDVLSGRTDATIEQLFALIHEVNPTGVDLPDSTRSERYRLKTGLQSLLIRRFGDDAVAVQATDDPTVVSLSDHTATRDACHANVDQLDDVARSWVRRRLDEASLPGDRDPIATTKPRASSAVEEPRFAGDRIGAGRQALEEFDYETAERYLTEELTVTAGGRDAARALLDLLVNHLGMDTAAVALQGRLSADAVGDSEVRALLALAAARCGEVAVALRWVRGIEGSRAASVWLALAEQRIKAGDLESARRHQMEAEECDVGHPGLVALRDHLRAAQEEDGRTADEALLGRVAVEGELALESQARVLLERWPHSRVATQILRHIAEHRRHLELADHLRAAAVAADEARFSEQVQHLRAALDLGGDDADLNDRVAAAEDQARRVEEQRQVDRVTEQLKSGDPRDSLIAYAALAKPIRAVVRAHAPAATSQRLAWLDEVNVPHAGSKARSAVAAVLAFEEAVALIGRGLADEALRRIETHSFWLDNLTDARELLARVRRQVAADRHTRALVAFESAEAAVLDGDLDTARSSLASVDPEVLTEDERARAAAFRTRLERSETTQRLLRDHERQLAAGDLIAARASAERLIEQVADDQTRADWRRRHAELRRRVASSFRVHVVQHPVPLVELCEALPQIHFAEAVQLSLDDEGQEMILTRHCERWLFLWVVAIASETVMTHVSLELSEQFEDLLFCCRDRDRLWLVGDRGDVLELDLDTWEVRSWHSTPIAAGMIVDDAVIVPGTSYLWLSLRDSEGAESTSVIDLAKGRTVRKLDAPLLSVVTRHDEAMVLSSGDRACLYSARGNALLAPYTWSDGVCAAATAPDGRGFAILRSSYDPFGEGLDEEIELHRLDPDPVVGAVRGWKFPFPSACADGRHAVACAMSQGLIFAIVDHGEQTMLMTAREVDSELRIIDSRMVPRTTQLLGDARARHVGALWTDQRGHRVSMLSADCLSALTPARNSKWNSILQLGPPHFCDSCSSVSEPRDESSICRLGETSEAWRAAARSRLAEVADDPDAMARLRYILRASGRGNEDDEWLIGEIVAHHPHRIGSILLQACTAANQARSDLVLALLEPRLNGAEVRALDGERARHLYHLAGIALLHAGRIDAAHKTFAKGLEIEGGSCQLQDLVDLTAPMRDPPRERDWSVDRSAIRQVVGALAIADRALATGNPTAAWAALARPAIWCLSHVQTAARIAATVLAIDADDGLRLHRRRLALARFLSLRKRQGERYHHDATLLPGRDYDEARLCDLESRATDWLDREVRPLVASITNPFLTP